MKYIDEINGHKDIYCRICGEKDAIAMGVEACENSPYRELTWHCLECGGRHFGYMLIAAADKLFAEYFDAL